MIRRDGQRRQQRTREIIPADKQIRTGLSNIHKYRPVNQTTLTGAIPFTSDSGSLPKDRPKGVHWGRWHGSWPLGMSLTTSNSEASRVVTLSFHSMRILNQIQTGTLSPSKWRWPILLPRSFSPKPQYQRPFVPFREVLRSRWNLQMLGSEVDHPSEEQKTLTIM
jgi:hypothetical protein